MSVSVGSAAPAVNIGILAELLARTDGVAPGIKQYQDAKAQAEQALADLKLGRDAKAAYDDANRKQAAADEAAVQAKAQLADAASLRAEADDYAVRVRGKVDVELAEAQAIRETAARELANVKAAESAALAREAQAVAAKRSADRSKQKYNAALASLKAAFTSDEE